jgi:tRNA-2-methylthio-N6-dimethylallyladenosine synthase
MTKFYHIITFGCQMNEHDSEKLAGLLEAEGYQPTTELERADVILLNTCCIRQKAEQKALSFLGRLKVLKEKRPELIIGLCGCLAQSQGADILRRTPQLELVLGTHNLQRLPQLLKEVASRRKPRLELGQQPLPLSAEPPPVSRNNPYQAWVAIMEGCDNYCTYCVVPYTRGRERSRPPGDILAEVRRLADNGCKEITLLGQNVNSYGKNLNNGIDFPRLLERLNQIPGIQRIRFVTSHPKDLSPALVQSMARLSKVCEHLHLPLQSGSDRVLQAMNRGYTLEEYLGKVRLLRELIPEISITTDIIVGFPGETEEDFEQTLKAIELAQFDSLFSFIYSDRPHTAALKLDHKVPRRLSQQRFQRLIRLQEEIARCRRRLEIGRQEEVLVEGPSKTDPGRLTGRTRSNKLVHFAGSLELTGKLIQVRITRAGKHSFQGEMVNSVSSPI